MTRFLPLALALSLVLPLTAQTPAGKIPQLATTDLNERPTTLPGDLEAEYSLLLVAFAMWQQREVDTWIPDGRVLEERFRNFRFHEIPLGEAGQEVRDFGNAGMRSGIPDPDIRARTHPIYVRGAPRAAILEAMAIEDTGHIQLFLVRRDGQVLWRAEGSRTPAARKELLAQVEKLCAVRPAPESDALVDLLAGDPRFRRTHERIVALGLEDLLAASGPLTLFLPTDEALGEDTLPAERAALREWIQRHTARGIHDPDALAGHRQVDTVARLDIPVGKAEDGMLTIDGHRVSGKLRWAKAGVVVPLAGAIAPTTEPMPRMKTMREVLQEAGQRRRERGR